MYWNTVWVAFLYLLQDISEASSEDCEPYRNSNIECGPIRVEDATICYTEYSSSFIWRHHWTATVTCYEGFRLNKQIKSECSWSLSNDWEWSNNVPFCIQVPTTRKPKVTNNSYTDKHSGPSAAVYVVPIVIIIIALVAMVIAFLLWRRKRRNEDQGQNEVTKRENFTVSNQLYDDTFIISDTTSHVPPSPKPEEHQPDDRDVDYENVQRKISNGNNSRINQPNVVISETVTQQDSIDSPDYEQPFTHAQDGDNQ